MSRGPNGRQANRQNLHGRVGYANEEIVEAVSGSAQSSRRVARPPNVQPIEIRDEDIGRCDKQGRTFGSSRDSVGTPDDDFLLAFPCTELSPRRAVRQSGRHHSDSARHAVLFGRGVRTSRPMCPGIDPRGIREARDVTQMRHATVQRGSQGHRARLEGLETRSRTADGQPLKVHDGSRRVGSLTRPRGSNRTERSDPSNNTGGCDMCGDTSQMAQRRPLPTLATTGPHLNRGEGPACRRHDRGEISTGG